MSELPTPGAADPRLTRPLPLAVAVPALALCAAAVLVLARLWHGSWTAVGTALIAPGLVGFGVFAVWLLERRRGRPFPRRIVVPWFVLFGGAAGGFAAAVAPSLGDVGSGILAGLFWGGIVGLGWVRSNPAA